MASRHERLRRDLLSIALQDEATLAQQNVALFLEKRRLRFKALKYAVKCRGYRRTLRLNEKLVGWRLMMKTMETIARVDSR